MTAVPLLLLSCLAAFHCIVSADLISEYAHHAVLNTEGKMRLFWTVDWDAETVSFALEAATTGWVGFGFSGRSGQMAGSDIVIGWVKNNKGYLTDRYAEAKAIPPIDEKQDYELTGFQESDGKTLLKFKRKFDTCDPRDRKLEVGTFKVVFAYHSGDPVSATEMKHHEFRGVKNILLLNSMDKRNISETGWKKFDLTARNMTIPGNKLTTYWCTLLKGPALKSKHYVTKIAPQIQKGNEGFTHHMILFECDGSFTEELFDEGVDCSNQDNLPGIPYLKCRSNALVAGWAVGGEGFYFPPHAGYPIGAADSSKYFLLETHYKNPNLIKGQKDSSGFTIYYTDRERKYDAAISVLGVGVSNWLIIPPKQKNWLSAGYCMHQCTESLFKNTKLPEGGINICAASLHTHLAGRASWTKHVRNGKELPEIARDDNYDPSFQETRYLRKEINIQPGDDIIHYCNYNSLDRDGMIRGGGSITDEMCLVFIMYYPRVKELSYCDNTFYAPSLKLLEKYFPSEKMKSFRGNPLASIDLKWSDEMVSDLRKYQDDAGTLIPGCWARNITSYKESESPKLRVPIPKITEPLPSKETCPVLSGADKTPFYSYRKEVTKFVKYLSLVTSESLKQAGNQDGVENKQDH